MACRISVLKADADADAEFIAELRQDKQQPHCKWLPQALIYYKRYTHINLNANRKKKERDRARKIESNREGGGGKIATDISGLTRLKSKTKWQLDKTLH